HDIECLCGQTTWCTAVNGNKTYYLILYAGRVTYLESLHSNRSRHGQRIFKACPPLRITRKPPGQILPHRAS
ncbi:hypothetical protein HDV57DRAFT_484909, partial [Trichoderma longibrachiatum]